MKAKKMIRCLLLALALLFSTVGALADTANFVVYDSEAMSEWSPKYGLSAPGSLLTLTKPDAEIHVIAYAPEGHTPETHLLAVLDDYAEHLDVQSIDGPYDWADPWNGFGKRIGINYKYVGGDATFTEQIYCAAKDGMLIEIMLDTWGIASAETVREFQSAFLNENFDISTFEIDTTASAYLSDVYREGENLYMTLNFFELTSDPDTSDQSVILDEEANSYVVSPNAMLWFPSANDLSLSYRVAVNLNDITDAVLNFEERMGSGLAFNFAFRAGEIIWMDYYYLP